MFSNGYNFIAVVSVAMHVVYRLQALATKQRFIITCRNDVGLGPYVTRRIRAKRMHTSHAVKGDCVIEPLRLHGGPQVPTFVQGPGTHHNHIHTTFPNVVLCHTTRKIAWCGCGVCVVCVVFGRRLTLVGHHDTIRYDTRCYFNVRSKADISQLNLPHGTDN